MYSGKQKEHGFWSCRGIHMQRTWMLWFFLFFSNYYHFFVPNFEVGSGPPGEHGLSQGRGAAEPRSRAGPSSLAPTLVPTGVHTLEASRCGLRPAPSRIEAGAATWKGGDWGGLGSPSA